MKVLVTGAGGYLGSRLSGRLLESGHGVVGIDRYEPKEKYSGEFVKLDFSNELERLEELLKDRQIEAVIHCGSIHPINNYPDDEYIRCNVTGCWNVLKAAADAGIRQIIHTSSISACGNYGSADVRLWPIREDFSVTPIDMYCLSKQVQENICQHFAQRFDMKIIAPRPGVFVYEHEKQISGAVKFLTHGTWIWDLVSVHIKALEGISKFEAGFYPYFTTSQSPFAVSEWRDVVKDVESVIRNKWKEFYERLKSEGRKIAAPGCVFNLTDAGRDLGWRPRMNLEQWLKIMETSK